MPKPYSNDLRTRVVMAVRSGETCRSVAKRFGVSVASVVKWSQRYRVTGSVSPDKMGGYRRPLLDPHRDFIIEQIERTPHLTLHALKDLLAARGIAVSHQTVWEFLRRQGLSFKKKRCLPLSEAALPSPIGGDVGGLGRPGLIPSAWCSSMKPGSRPTWRHSGAGGQKASA